MGKDQIVVLRFLNLEEYIPNERIELMKKWAERCTKFLMHCMDDEEVYKVGLNIADKDILTMMMDNFEDLCSDCKVEITLAFEEELARIFKLERE